MYDEDEEQEEEAHDEEPLEGKVRLTPAEKDRSWGRSEGSWGGSIWVLNQKWGWFFPQIIHFNRVFHYKPSILGYPYFWKHPFGALVVKVRFFLMRRLCCLGLWFM